MIINNELALGEMREVILSLIRVTQNLGIVGMMEVVRRRPLARRRLRGSILSFLVHMFAALSSVVVVVATLRWPYYYQYRNTRVVWGRSFLSTILRRVRFSAFAARNYFSS